MYILCICRVLRAADQHSPGGRLTGQWACCITRYGCLGHTRAVPVNIEPSELVTNCRAPPGPPGTLPPLPGPAPAPGGNPEKARAADGRTGMGGRQGPGGGARPICRAVGVRQFQDSGHGAQVELQSIRPVGKRRPTSPTRRVELMLMSSSGVCIVPVSAGDLGDSPDPPPCVTHRGLRQCLGGNAGVHVGSRAGSAQKEKVERSERGEGKQQHATTAEMPVPTHISYGQQTVGISGRLMRAAGNSRNSKSILVQAGPGAPWRSIYIPSH